MKRLARVVARSNCAVILQLIKAEKCVGCPSNCNEPLVDLFAMRKNHFSLSKTASQYELIDENDLLNKPDLLDQLVSLKINHQDLMKSSAMLYLMPLVICLIFLTLGHYFGQWQHLPADLTAGVGFICGLLVVYLLVQTKSKILPLNFRPKVTIL